MSAAGEANFRAKAPKYMRMFMSDFDADSITAAAVMGNGGHESDGFTNLEEDNPTVPGSRGGFGWFQWTGPRRREFEAYCARNGYDPRSDEANYKFLWVELHGPEKQAVELVKKPGSLSDKVIRFENSFERSGIKHYDSRLRWAERAIAAYRTGPMPEPPPILPQPPPLPDKEPTMPITPPTVNVPVESPWYSKINWVSLAGPVASLAVALGWDVNESTVQQLMTLVGVIIGIQGGQGLLTIIFRTFFTNKMLSPSVRR